MDQYSWLTRKKAELSSALGKAVTWDDFARHVDIEPRALKNYRLPESSSNHRTLSKTIRGLIELRVQIQSAGSHSTSHEQHDGQLNQQPSGDKETNATLSFNGDHLLLFRLAGLLVRHCAFALEPDTVVSGISNFAGSNLGLLAEERRTLSELSKLALRSGRPDVFSEIHQVIYLATTPCGQWLDFMDINSLGLGDLPLIDQQTMTPTEACSSLASNCKEASTLYEEALFREFLGILEEFPRKKSHMIYTKVREFVIRHPMVTPMDLNKLSFAPKVANFIHDHFYEPYCSDHVGSQTIKICNHCGSEVKSGPYGLACSLRACAESQSESYNETDVKDGLRRASLGIQRFWINPGFDEVRLFDALKEAGVDQLELFPERDMTDISVGGYEIGIDLKSHGSPEVLGYALKDSIKGLSGFKSKIICIPDRLVRRNEGYLQTVKEISGRRDILVMSVSQTKHHLLELRAGGGY